MAAEDHSEGNNFLDIEYAYLYRHTMTRAELEEDRKALNASII